VPGDTSIRCQNFIIASLRRPKMQSLEKVFTCWNCLHFYYSFNTCLHFYYSFCTCLHFYYLFCTFQSMAAVIKSCVFKHFSRYVASRRYNTSRKGTFWQTKELMVRLISQNKCGEDTQSFDTVHSRFCEYRRGRDNSWSVIQWIPYYRYYWMLINNLVSLLFK
jgi:hypothetical protein